ncbi:VOC family protein [Paenibacillus contaminans]|uniref:VOC family protein n=1 Tax=Paenibacillus contaminans TaxID=450362 RepID=A0A329MQ12_9BACL|nr:VOC family protein [Paenibacillus contaminans]RAV21558.1 VOC family protein [Paenibacillus contaminans]
MKLTQIRLMTNDFHKCVVFYRDVMEFPLGTYAEGMQFASFNTGETKIEIFSRHQISEVIGEKNLSNDVESQSKFLLSFAVDQVDEAYVGLKHKGVLFLNEPHDRKEWNARVVHLKDPDGNVIELYKHPL